MITITPAKERDIKNILAKYDYILSENLDELKYENTMILEERGKIYGVSSYTYVEDIAKIDVIYIDEDKRRLKFGDSLIKATLNLIDRRKITRAYVVMNKEYEGFLISATLIKSAKEQYESDFAKFTFGELIDDNNKVVYHAELPAYFNTACRSSHKN